MKSYNDLPTDYDVTDILDIAKSKLENSKTILSEFDEKYAKEPTLPKSRFERMHASEIQSNIDDVRETIVATLEENQALVTALEGIAHYKAPDGVDGMSGGPFYDATEEETPILRPPSQPA